MFVNCVPGGELSLGLGIQVERPERKKTQTICKGIQIDSGSNEISETCARNLLPSRLLLRSNHISNMFMFPMTNDRAEQLRHGIVPYTMETFASKI